jgi:miniconductance mechanosensitive channel
MKNLKGDYLQNLLSHVFQDLGLNNTQINLLNGAIDIILIVIVALIANWIAKKIIIKIIKTYVDHSKTNWDDIIYEKGVFNRLSHLAPALVIMGLIHIPLNELPGFVVFIETLTRAYMVIVVTMVLISFSNALHEIYLTFEISKQRSIKGYIQMLKMIIYFIAVLVIISILFHAKISSLLAGLGASVAVLLLVFKDTILGLVGSIQLSSNDMVRIGDWIEMPKYGADGNVIEMNLTTVKVRNANNTISTIPTYAMVSDSFINWRGMTESEGRRIKRSFFIDIKSIKFCDKNMLEKFEKIDLLKDFLAAQKESGQCRNITNVSILRNYIENYIRANENININLPLIIRQLQSGEHGLPIEVYCFSKIKEFKGYEAVQSDIFDHILAIIPEFGLNVFQEPTGDDFKKLLS